MRKDLLPLLRKRASFEELRPQQWEDAGYQKLWTPSAAGLEFWWKDGYLHIVDGDVIHEAADGYTEGQAIRLAQRGEMPGVIKKRG